MYEISIIKGKDDLQGLLSIDTLIDFLYQHLDEFRDSRSAIKKAIDYALSTEKGKGGFIITAMDDVEVVGVVIINKTGMSEYIPENILVYIAVHKEYRGRGIGETLLKKTLERTDGDIALHVEHDNRTAISLYQKIGFKTKYIEMRYLKCQN
ncbi:MAG: GNAT family N-acetyltransferase [Candidatus Cloacimonetes bacterium]|nr:GNAT family N-acetyltransferase [Candidatus Cloacimonadota bacterium]